jgi:hypothetical protein
MVGFAPLKLATVEVQILKLPGQVETNDVTQGLSSSATYVSFFEADADD